MRNRPEIIWDATSFDESDDFQLATSHSPTLRFRVLFLLLLLPVSVVAARLAYLQASLGPQYLAAWETTTVQEEPLPCRDGRILSADGQILARDRLRFDVLVHYRWIEEPADEAWLKQQALSGLTRLQRRDDGRVTQSTDAVLKRRADLWDLLAETTGRTRTQLDRQRTAIQHRVERIVENVNRRQEQRMNDAPRQVLSDETLQRLRQLEPTSKDLEHLGAALVSELTTPPRRGTSESIIVVEELSHHLVVSDVDLQTVAAIESAPSLFPGVRIRASSERVYPAGDAAAHIVGVRTEVTPEDLQENDPLEMSTRPGDRIGRSGIERAFDQTLRGRRGTLRIIKDRRGEILSQSVIASPIHGGDVVLTLDAQLQRKAEQLLDGVITGADESRSTKRGPNGGCLICLDVRTGDVITAAAAPRFDLQLLLNPDPADWERAITDPRRPFFPRVTQMTVPPGSVFKILTSIALLESRLIDPDEPVFCQGYLDRPDRNRCYIFRHYGIGHGDMTLSDAICQSCNVYFFHAARSLGPGPILDWAARFGLGLAPGSEVPGEKEGHLPRANSSGRIVDEQWYNGSTLQLAIGQASLTVTPLQVARMVAAVANDGFLVTPRFVQSTPEPSPASEGADIRLASYFDTAEDPSTVERIAGLSDGTLASVRRGMRLVVDHRQGTGKRIRMDEIAIAGKTGTAEVGGGKGDHAWFVGFVPADAPRYAFVVVIEHGGSGGAVAAPIAKDYIQAMLDTGLLPRTPPPTEQPAE